MQAQKRRMQKGNRHMIWLLQLEIMKLFHCSQVSLDRERWTNSQNPGALVSSMCDCNCLLPKTEFGGSSSLGAPKQAHPVLSVEFTTPYNHLGPRNSSLLCTRFPIPSQQFRAQLFTVHTLFCKIAFPFQTCTRRETKANLPRHRTF